MSTPLHYICYRATTPLTIDGDLTKAAWQYAPWTANFVDIEGDKKPHPRYRTRVKMLWDDEFFYIGAEMEEPHVWATLTEHDSVIFHDNDFEVFIDPDSDNHEYYEFEINALNTTWDLRLVKPYRDGGPPLNDWEIPGMRHAVRIDGTLNDSRDTDTGWSVEMAFPWKVLGEYARGCTAPPNEGNQWRVNFSRVEWDVATTPEGGYHKIPKHPEHNWVWSPQGVIDMHQPEHWGYVQFTYVAPGTATFTPPPSAAARAYLMRVYHAQKQYQDKNRKWADNLDTLAILVPDGVSDAQLHRTANGYEASATFMRPGDSQPGRVIVREDSLIQER